MPDDSVYREWWESKWKERESLLRQRFGETQPPGHVTAFFWDDIRWTVPGGCAIIFPPHLPSRSHWLTLTHGLTQPASPAAHQHRAEMSGIGYEYGFVTRTNSPWTCEGLKQLMTYVAQSANPILQGHRVPMWFQIGDNAMMNPVIGIPVVEEGDRPVTQMRAVLFWPYQLEPRVLSTSTGGFRVLIGTTITKLEWEMAKASSSAHLLLLLTTAEIGQLSDVERTSVTDNSKLAKEWDKIQRLEIAEVERELNERKVPPMA